MNLADALTLYAPLVGLLGVVFWLGVLSNRVVTLEREARERKNRDSRDSDHSADIGDRLKTLEITYKLHSEGVTFALADIKREGHAGAEAINRLTTIKLENQASMETLKRELAAVQRDLAKLMKRPTTVKEFAQEGQL